MIREHQEKQYITSRRLDEIRKWFSGSGQDKPADKAAAAAPAPAAPTVNLTVTLDGREIATAVEQRFDRDGRKNNG